MKEIEIPEGYEARIEGNKVILESKESEDEKIRNKLVQFLTDIKNISESGRTSWAVRREDAEMCAGFLAYLEKQKEQSKEELVYRLNGLMQEYIKEGKDEAEKEHRFKCYQLFWDALEDASYFEQKEQKSAKYIKRNSKEWYSLLAEQYDKGFWKGKSEQKPVEWSERDEKIINDVCNTIVSNAKNGYLGRYSVSYLVDRLKSLCPHWKPTKEQMRAFEETLFSVAYTENRFILSSMLEQLKKLM